jgi:hypothetical protein
MGRSELNAGSPAVTFVAPQASLVTKRGVLINCT